jgi:hypothetical protein
VVDTEITSVVYSVNLNHTALNYLKVDYQCGSEDINLALNLPAVELKEFVGNFIKYFNLSFYSNNSKTITFDFNNNYTNKLNNNYDISSRVISNSETLKPNTSYRRLNIGYKNDSSDRLLTELIGNCEGSDPIQTPSEYGNILIRNEKNYYSHNELDIRNGFSATRFINGFLELTDTDNYIITSVYLNHPITGSPFLQGITYTPPALLKLNPYIPSIQSRESFNQGLVQDLEYNYNYTPRILYHLGTTKTYLGYGDEFRIKTGSPQISLVLNQVKDF